MQEAYHKQYIVKLQNSMFHENLLISQAYSEPY